MLNNLVTQNMTAQDSRSKAKRFGRAKLFLTLIFSLAMFTSLTIAQDTTTTDLPPDLAINQVQDMTDEEFVKIPLEDKDEMRRRAALLEYYKPGGQGYPLNITIDAIQPNGGPVSGTTRVTVYGGPFKDMMLIHPKPKCKFGKNSMIVAATYTSCRVKPMGIGEVEANKALRTEWCIQCGDSPASSDAEIVNLQVSVTGDFTDSNDSEPFRYYHVPSVTAIYPHYGPKDGGTLIKVWGENFLNFDDNTRCNFGSKSVSVRFYSSTYIECLSPFSDTVGFAIPFSVTLNIQQNSKNNMPYYYFNRPTISKLLPNYGPASGGNDVLLSGSSFDPFIELPVIKFGFGGFRDLASINTYDYTEAQRMNTNDTFCVFQGVAKTKAHIISSTQAVCVAPPSEIDSADVYITLNNQDYSDDDVIYYWYKAPKLYDISPKYGPTEGGTKVHLFGTDFKKDKQMQCLFDGIASNATFISSQEIECVSPPHKAGVIPVQATYIGDRGKSVSEPIYFTFVERPQILDIDPPCGPVQGYTQIKVTGKNFVNLGPDMAFCVFNNTHFMNVTFIDENHLYCSTPRLPENERSQPAMDMVYEVKITVDDRSTFTLAHVNFGYYFDSEISAVVDSERGPVIGGTQSYVHGKGFKHPNVCRFRVRYGALEVTPQVFNDTVFLSYSPKVNLPGAVVLSTSGNAQNYANDITLHYRDKENTYTYYQEIFVNYLNPQQGPNSGKTKVTVRALGLNQFKKDDGTPDTSKPLYIRLLSDTNNTVGNVTTITNLTNDQFVFFTPPCPTDSKRLILETSWNGKDWQPIIPAGKNYSYEYYDAPEVTSVNPHFGPVKSPNNETITITGKNFVCPNADCSNLKVRFGDPDFGIYVPGTWIDEQHVKCDVPKYTKPDVLPVEVSTDGHDYTNNGVTYGFFDAYLLDVEPRLISRLGGTPLVLSGFGFVNAGEGETKVKFSSKGKGELNCGTTPCINQANYIDKNTIHTKSLPQGNLLYTNTSTSIGQNGFTVEASVYNNQFTKNNIEVFYIFDPLFKAISRNQTPINLSLPILVTTEFYWEQNDYDKFAKFGNFSCRFTVGNDTYVTLARMETMPLGSRYENDDVPKDKRILPTHVLCASPRVTKAGKGTMDISINSFDYSGNFPFQFTESVDVYRVAPACGPTGEKTRVQLIGTGFKENKDTLIEKTGVFESTDFKTQEVKSMNWSESEFLASMQMTAQDLLTFKYVEFPLQANQTLQSVFINVLPIPGLNQTYGGANGVSLGEEISFSVYNDTKPVVAEAKESTGSRRLQSEDQIDKVDVVLNAAANSTAPANTTLPIQAAVPPNNATNATQTKTNKLVMASTAAKNFKFTNSNTEFKTYKQPVVKKAFPNMGLTEGGTLLELSGAWFDQQLEFEMMPYCKIGKKVVRGQYISTVRIVCKTPPNDNIIAAQPIFVSLNGVNWVDTGFTFSYYMQPTLTGLSPKYGTMSGGTEIMIAGLHFSNITDPEFVKCKFTLIGEGRQASPKFIPAIYKDQQTMMCVSPNGFFGGEAVNVQMTFNGLDFTEPKEYLVFNYYTILGSFPHSGPADGFDQVILVRGSGLKSSDQVICSLNNTDIAPVDVSPNLIQCPMCLPGKDPNAIGLVKFGVTIHGVYNDFGNFYYYDQIGLLSMDPHFGPNEGKGDIFFEGARLRDDFPGAQLGCKIGVAVGEAVLNEDKTVMRCVIEKMALAKENEPFEAKFALNSYSWVGTSPAQLYMPYGVIDIQPRSGPYDGFTDIFITGAGFTPEIAEFAKCRFGVDQDFAVVDAEVLDFNRMTCRSPETFKLPTEGSKTISVPFGIAFGNENYHPWTLDKNRYMFYENPYLVQATPAEVKIGRMAEIFVRADSKQPYLEPVPSGPNNSIEPIMCNFEQFGNSMGLYINDTYVMCVSPRITGHPDDYYRETVTVRVAINGQDFQEVQSEAEVTFVGTGSAKGFVNFIIATILIALLIIGLVFLVMALMAGRKQKINPNTRHDLRDNNQYQTQLGRASNTGRNTAQGARGTGDRSASRAYRPNSVGFGRP